MALSALYLVLFFLSFTAFAQQMEGGPPTTPVHPITVSTWASTVLTPLSGFPVPNHYETMTPQSPQQTSGVSAATSNSDHTVIIAVTAVCSVLGTLALVAAAFAISRCLHRRSAVKRRRHASWILRISQWNNESKPVGDQQSDIHQHPVTKPQQFV